MAINSEWNQLGAFVAEVGGREGEDAGHTERPFAVPHESHDNVQHKAMVQSPRLRATDLEFCCLFNLFLSKWFHNWLH